MSYSDLKVNELRQILKERGIPSTGLTRKAQIVEHLERDDAAKTQDPAGEGGTEGPDATVGNDIEDHQTTEDELGQDPVVAEEIGPATAATSEAANDAGSPAQVTQEVMEQDRPREDDSTGETSPPKFPAAGNERQPEEETTETVGMAMEVTRNDGMGASPEEAAEANFDIGNAPVHTASSQEPETRKRKRRSPTPPPSEDTINKKLKAAAGEIPELEEDEQLARTARKSEINEDALLEDAPAPLRSDEAEEVHSETAIPASTTDELTNVKTPMSKPADLDAQMDEEDPDVSIPMHPTTCALYIRNLLRPLQLSNLRSHLQSLASSTNLSGDAEILKDLHLDSLKSHAFALFETKAAASRVRSRLHNQVWPSESTRKPLIVDFIPESKLDHWIQLEEKGSSGRRGDSKRWEVVYERDSDGNVNAELKEVVPGSLHRQGSGLGGAPGTGPGSWPGRRPSFQGSEFTLLQQGVGMPGAPSGPRGVSRTYSGSGPSRALPPPATKPVAKTAAFLDLDARFPSTSTKPKLYFRPIDRETADRRLEAFDAETSRDWDGDMSGGGQGGQQLRRYTFENDDRIVDGGADFGHFGRNKVGGDRFRPGGPGGPPRRGGRNRR